MEIIVKENYQEMSLYAAGMVADLIRRKPDCVIGFATGRTPVGTYQELIRLHKAGLDFSGIRAFNLDEYLGIGRDMSKPYDQDQSYARFMYEELFRHINVKEENIHIPDGLAKDPDAFCVAYEQEISKAGGIDLQILGIGGDGHWGFNEPGASLSSRTRVENLTAQTLDDNYKAFYRKAGIPREQMPTQAITMGIGTILEARNLIMIANGSKKAGIIAKALQGPITSAVTASAIQLYTGKAVVVLDREAASALKNLE
ncbi:MAG: glucosamine-6-phosphate deaminase [Saccharofermentanales bacterium]|jgi:glucosamine-6-phosphate deaminase|nr:glucosamine-6-phosphate deaminase [Clostridiaceae bacterium]